MSTTLAAETVSVADQESVLTSPDVAGARRGLNSPARDGPRRVLHRIARVLEDAVLLLFAVLLLPLSILLVGTVVALCLWAIREAARLF